VKFHHSTAKLSNSHHRLSAHQRYTSVMPVLDLTKAELEYLAKMNAENMDVMQFLDSKGRPVRDLSTARRLHERFMTLLPEGIPTVQADFRKNQAVSKSRTKQTPQKHKPKTDVI
jgi:glutamate 5-kinase